MTTYKLEYRQHDKERFVLVGYYPNYASVTEQANQILAKNIVNGNYVSVLISME